MLKAHRKIGFIAGYSCVKGEETWHCAGNICLLHPSQPIHFAFERIENAAYRLKPDQIESTSFPPTFLVTLYICLPKNSSSQNSEMIFGKILLYRLVHRHSHFHFTHTLQIESTGKNVNHQQGMPLLLAAIRFYNIVVEVASPTTNQCRLSLSVYEFCVSHFSRGCKWENFHSFILLSVTYF